MHDHNPLTSGPPTGGSLELRLLSFNIQAGTATTSYQNYVTHSWRQILPHSQRTENLDSIASLIKSYDMVALQEVDSGSLRSGFINQSRYLAGHSGMPYWVHQNNRKVGNVAYAGNGFLSRFEPDEVFEYRLPGPIPGRGSLVLRYGEGSGSLTVAVLHLALGKRARKQQLEFLASKLETNGQLIVMGDLNAPLSNPETRAFCDRLELATPTHELPSYPSWQPQRAIDHIMLSRNLSAFDARVVNVGFSDHCPVELRVQLPTDLTLREALHPRASL
ncbi:MAG TPA: endonuclease/exonuclease/phosphatase family protein [Xanthomonadales bacterium]|nr:endonuclease/exonuclease/phosphatase family protein [Xanthomonadales bacterium]